MARTNSLGVRVEQEIKDALEVAAKADDRSLSSMVERVLRGWLQENGFLPKPEPLPLPKVARELPARAKVKRSVKGR